MVRLRALYASMAIASGIRHRRQRSCHAERLPCCVWSPDRVRLRFLRQPARAATLEELVSAVVRIKTSITPDGQTVQCLGREREGSGIVIDEDGLSSPSAT